MAEEKVKQKERRVLSRAIDKLREAGHFVFLAASPEIGRHFQLLGLPPYPGDRPVLVRVSIGSLEEEEVKAIADFRAGEFKKEAWIWIPDESRFAVFRWHERFLLGGERELRTLVKKKSPQQVEGKKRSSEGNLHETEGILQAGRRPRKPGL
jgi:hypothetical protein